MTHSKSGDIFAPGTPPFTHYFEEFCAVCRPEKVKPKIYDCRVRCIGRGPHDRCGYPLREASGANLQRGLCAECQHERTLRPTDEVDLGGALRLMAAVVTQAQIEARWDRPSASALAFLKSAKDPDTIIGHFISYAAIKEGLSHEARLVL